MIIKQETFNRELAITDALEETSQGHLYHDNELRLESLCDRFGFRKFSCLIYFFTRASKQNKLK